MKKYDLEDPRVKVTYGFLKKVLENSDSKALPEYFSESGVLIINEKELHGIDEIAARIGWIHQNATSVKVDIQEIFFVDHRGFESHFTDFIDKEGKYSRYKIFTYLEIVDGKISRFEDVTIALSGDIGAATSVESAA